MIVDQTRNRPSALAFAAALFDLPVVFSAAGLYALMAVAVPEAAGIPVTHRGVASAVHIVNGQSEMTPATLAALGDDGVTTVVMGNCGVGIAPCRPEAREIATWDLVNVEGIPIDTLAKGITWDWESFPQYMDAAMEVEPWAWIYFVSFVLIATFVVLNVVIAIIVNSMDEVRAMELERERKELVAAALHDGEDDRRLHERRRDQAAVWPTTPAASAQPLVPAPTRYPRRPRAP